jgi:hypothetical protein
MRILLTLLAATVLALPVKAQTTTPTPEQPKTTTDSAASDSPAAPTAHKRLTMDQRFQQANTSHDGHLTLDQAKSGYKTVARHFAAIDQDKKGYVTEEDIRNYLKSQRALHHQSASSAHQPSS